MDWQLIETAPKDDTPILVYTGSRYVSEAIMIAQWRNGYFHIHIDDQIIEPTHWMPLPPAPIKGVV